MKAMPFAYLFSFCVLLTQNSFGLSLEQELRAMDFLRQECLKNLAYILQDSMNVECNHTSHSYKSKVAPSELKSSKSIRISTFNLLHPGMAKTIYKDIPHIAKIMNSFDIVAATELIPVMGEQFSHNISVMSFMKKAPEFIQITIDKILKERSETEKRKQVDRLDQLVRDFEEGRRIIRGPGYLEILTELQKLDATWSLELSPRGEASKPTDQQELVGFYYRSSTVETEENPYCKKLPLPFMGNAHTCLPLMGKEVFDNEIGTLFSRRPFMASFKSSKKTFTLLSSHVVYTSDTNPERMKNIMQTAFQVDSPDQLGVGITKENYARFAEVKMTLEFIEQLKKRFNMKRIIYLGDLNLEPSNQFWPKMLADYPDLVLTHDHKTTISPARINARGEETLGLSSSYDHMLLNIAEFKECHTENKNELNIGVYDFINDKNELLKLHNIKELNDQSRESKINKFAKLFHSVHEKLKTVRYNQIVPDHNKLTDKVQNLKDRVYKTQLQDSTYYRHASELISDHLPIWLECQQ